MAEKRLEHRVSMATPVRKRTLGRPRSRWEDNIKMNLQEVAWGMHCIDLIKLRIRTGDRLL
jgi:hypothetical protein